MLALTSKLLGVHIMKGSVFIIESIKRYHGMFYFFIEEVLNSLSSEQLSMVFHKSTSRI